MVSAPRSRDGGSRDGDWLELVAELMASPLTTWPAQQVTRLFVGTFDAFGCNYYARDATGRLGHVYWPRQRFAPYLDELLTFADLEAPTQHPLLRYYRATSDTRCMQVAEVPSRIADHRVMDRWEARARRWGGVQSQLSVPLLTGPTANEAFVVGRADPFTGEDMALAHRLQRLLIGLDRQVRAYSSWSARHGPSGVEVASGVGLTPRELAVLELLAHGLTARAIGRRLHIVERTVQKHLQRCYVKLGVSDRLTAVLRAETIGLLRAP